jgi:uncharacterized protein
MANVTKVAWRNGLLVKKRQESFSASTEDLTTKTAPFVPRNPWLSAGLYIVLVAVFLWLPLVYFVIGIDPGELFTSAKDLAAALMFFTGAVIANATAIGGGIVFNPMLQFVFGVSGLSALLLSVTVQCSGMASGTYGWYRRGEFQKVERKHLLAMGGCTIVASVASTAVLVIGVRQFPEVMLPVMKALSVLVAFYVFAILWLDIRRASKVDTPQRGGPEAADGRAGVGAGVACAGEPDLLRVDRRVYKWICLGSLLNVHTAVGAGELTFAHLIKYYRCHASTAVAVGAMCQLLSVLTQTVFNLIFLRSYMLWSLISIGLLFTMMGGRIAPLIMSSRVVAPYTKHILAFTALSMGIISAALLIRNLM